MRAFIAICMIFVSTLAWTADQPVAAPPDSAPVKGKVLEVKQVNNYTYLRLKTQNGDVWTAVPTAQVKKGATVTIENVSVITDFESRTLNQKFPTIMFGTLSDPSFKMKEIHSTAKSNPVLDKKTAAADIRVAKAKGDNAKTVAEINKMSKELKNKPVLVSGKVVKYNQGIMGKNWLHLRDGTGSAADNSNDILVTTQSPAKIGDIVTVKGIVHTDMNFGTGYSYKVLIEEATIQ